MRRALLSVSDKTGIAEFARELQKQGFEIISTGGTAKTLQETGIPVTPIEKITGFPECFSGRLKSMHPKILGGILFRRGERDQEEEARELGIEPIDLVAVNLYPFGEDSRTQRFQDSKKPRFQEAKTPGLKDSKIPRSQDSKEEVELIDVGGPTLLRSAAKNYESVTVLCDPADYGCVLQEIALKGETSLSLRRELAAKVFLRTSSYDGLITEWLSEGGNCALALDSRLELRYGENPHQTGAYFDVNGMPRFWRVLQEERPFDFSQGRQMSYLNILDADSAWNLVREFTEPTAACIKHANPSGVASHEDISEAFQRCYDADKLSAFGVIIALNRECPGGVIEKIIKQKIFAEVIIAPGFSKEALELLREKPKIRAIAVERGESIEVERASTFAPSELPSRVGKALVDKKSKEQSAGLTFRSALGGMLVQSEDDRVVTEEDLQCVTSRRPTDEQICDLLFAWKVVKHSKSNAIVFAKDQVTVGIGCGQTSRVDATWLAARKSRGASQGAVMASDAFFPFPDSIEEAAKHGISAIIQPGGSVRDEEIFSKAEELGIVMVVTGLRAFRH